MVNSRAARPTKGRREAPWLLTCTRPPAEGPSVFLQRMPATSSPLLMLTCVSFLEKSGLSLLMAPSDLFRRFSLGSSIEKTCLPVHIGSGLRIAGIGTVPSQSSRHMQMFMKRSLGMKTSRRVSRLQPRSVSWTIPMTGLFRCGETMLSGTIIRFFISARVSGV